EEKESRPDIADILPVERFCSFFDLVGERATVIVSSEEEIPTALADHWQDVTTSLHSEDADHLYLPPSEVKEALERRVAVSFSAVAHEQPHEFRAQAADSAARTIADAEPELEKLVRS